MTASRSGLLVLTAVLLSAAPVVAQTRVSAGSQLTTSSTRLISDVVAPAGRDTTVELRSVYVRLERKRWWAEGSVGGDGSAGGPFGLDWGVAASVRLLKKGRMRVSGVVGYGSRQLRGQDTTGAIEVGMSVRAREAMLMLRHDLRFLEDRFRIFTVFGGSHRSEPDACDLSLRFTDTGTGLTCPCDHPGVEVPLRPIRTGGGGVSGVGGVGFDLQIPVPSSRWYLEATGARFGRLFGQSKIVADPASEAAAVRGLFGSWSLRFGIGRQF